MLWISSAESTVKNIQYNNVIKYVEKLIRPTKIKIVCSASAININNSRDTLHADNILRP